MNRALGALLIAMTAMTVASPARAGEPGRRADRYGARMADWRMRQVVYQVLVDRFFAPADPKSRAELYQPPRRLRRWTDQPRKGKFLPEAKVWSHEVDFWGGTLDGVREKLDHIQSMGANVLYLNPVFEAYTNHKYDTIDYFRIDPQFGGREAFERLCAEAHRRGMHVVLDGVFNHVGQRSKWFCEALADPKSRYRQLFSFDPKLPAGYVCWYDAPSLPELSYDTDLARDTIYRTPASVVQSWLALADGWRLDVAGDLGPTLLSEITAAAHKAKAGSLVVGELYVYPQDWIPAVDATMNMFLARMILELAAGRLPARTAAGMLEDLVRDTDYEGLLRSWIVLSNHDRSRLKTSLPDLSARAFALALQVSLPGAPLVYYGDEVGLTGADDPLQRGPMDWDAVASSRAPELALFRKLMALRQNHRALAVGDLKVVRSEKLFCFLRSTDTVRDTVLVVANPTRSTVTELIAPRDSWLMDDSALGDLLSDATTRIHAGLVQVSVPPGTVQLLVPRIPTKGYSRFKRVP